MKIHTISAEDFKDFEGSVLMASAGALDGLRKRLSIHVNTLTCNAQYVLEHGEKRKTIKYAVDAIAEYNEL